MKFKLENFRTKLDKCPVCGCKSLFISGAGITFDGCLHITSLECDNPECNALFVFRGGWLKLYSV